MYNIRKFNFLTAVSILSIFISQAEAFDETDPIGESNRSLSKVLYETSRDIISKVEVNLTPSITNDEVIEELRERGLSAFSEWAQGKFGAAEQEMKRIRQLSTPEGKIKFEEQILPLGISLKDLKERKVVFQTLFNMINLKLEEKDCLGVRRTPLPETPSDEALKAQITKANQYLEKFTKDQLGILSNGKKAKTIAKEFKSAVDMKLFDEITEGLFVKIALSLSEAKLDQIKMSSPTSDTNGIFSLPPNEVADELDKRIYKLCQDAVEKFREMHYSDRAFWLEMERKMQEKNKKGFGSLCQEVELALAKFLSTTAPKSTLK